MIRWALALAQLLYLTFRAHPRAFVAVWVALIILGVIFAPPRYHLAFSSSSGTFETYCIDRTNNVAVDMSYCAVKR